MSLHSGLTELLSGFQVHDAAEESEELDEPDIEDPECNPEDPFTHTTTFEDEDRTEDIPLRNGNSPCRNRTKKYREYHNARGPDSLVAAVRAVCLCIRNEKLDLPLLLWALSWNVPELVNDELVKFERVSLLSSTELLPLLRTWHKPPRGHGRGVRSKGAAATLDAFALEQVVLTARTEMASVGTYMRTHPDDLSADTLLSIKIPEMKQAVKARAPTVWTVLRECAYTSLQAKRNTNKDPDTPVLWMISMASFTRSNRNNALQRLTAVYLKACGTSAKAFDTLSAIGLTMSQVWTYSALEKLSKSERESLLTDLKNFPWFGAHDNVNFRFRVFEQRSDHQSNFDSGTTGTIFVIRDPDAVAPSGSSLRAHRALQRSRSLISAGEVFAMEARAAPSLASCATDTILQTLLATPSFDLETYKHKGHPLLRPSDRPGQLRVGHESESVKQYLLDTVHIEEASYEGNQRVMEEWLRQLRLNSLRAQMRTGLDLVALWIGDQLTASRLRGLLRFRRDDYNSFERLDWLVPTFGWFHLMFAFEQSLHAQYYGTRTGLGLVHAFEVLGRRGLHATSTQGTFHHTFEEALDHTFRAHIGALWCLVGGVQNLEDLWSCTPEKLVELAARIRDEHASSIALVRLDNNTSGLPQKVLDPLHRQVTQFTRDVLDYIILRDAISCGDIQTMENMLPRLLFRFSGGSNPNYTVEVCELMQNLHYDWPEDLKTYVRKYCWLTNTSGHQSSYIPIDRAQEHNVLAVKHTFGTSGPFSTWDYLGRTSASIPAQRRVKDHVECEVNHGYRGKSHTRPQEDSDISKLQLVYQEARIHTPLAARHKLESADRFSEVMRSGAEAVSSGKAFKAWAKNRLAEPRVVDEIWDDVDTAQGSG